jgi:hypothetical protein
VIQAQLGYNIAQGWRLFVRLLGAAAAFLTVLVLTLPDTLAFGERPLGGQSEEHPPTAFDPLLLNIRMSPTSLHPPADMIKDSWVLEGYRLGRLGPQAPRAAIIDDDQHHRVLIISATEDGMVRVYRLGPLPMDLGSRSATILRCAQTRNCQHARMDPAGEIGCLAICLLEGMQE